MKGRRLTRMADLIHLPAIQLVLGSDEDVESFLQTVDRQLEPYLKRSLTCIPAEDGLKEGVSYQVHSGGKRIRAALCVTVCELFCGSSQRALSFAVALEHLQNFSLIHDDIADGDPQRRGQASAWACFGLAQAITLGDVFVALSAISILESTYSQQLKLRLMQLAAQWGLEMAEGQSLDIQLRANNTPSVEAYLECTKKKTGAFLAMAMLGGGVIGGAREKDLSALKEFALLAGTAFQIRDDLLDLLGSKGRPIGSDILEGKRTLPVIHALQHASDAERSRLLSILNTPRVANTADEVQWVCQLYQQTGAIEYAEGLSEHLIEQASVHFRTLPERKAKYRLARIATYLSQRKH